jgi:tetratricopeptide (TPR) repeat protein
MWSKFQLFFLITFGFQCFLVGQERSLSKAVETQQVYTNVHAIIIGVSDYEEVPSLRYADNDAELIEKVISTNFSGTIGQVIKLTNDKATEFTIVSAMLKIGKVAAANDLVIIYLAGHGDVAEGLDGNKEGYFLGYNASESRDYETGGAVSFERVNKFVSGLTNRGVQVWLITDACRSGKIIDSQGASTTISAIINGYQNTTKFVSCGSNQLSYEDSTLKQGVFTYYFTKGLAGEADTEVDGIITPDELSQYLKKQVRTHTKQRQTPHISTPDEFAQMFSVNSKYLNYLDASYELALKKELERKKTSASNMANGGKRSMTSNEESNLSRQFIQFEDALIEGNLYGKSGSALELLRKFKSSKEVNEEELAYMNDLLVNALMERVQRNTNRFLNGKPILSPEQDFKTSLTDLKYVKELLGSDHPLLPKIENRMAFFEAMEIVRTQSMDMLGKAEKQLLDLELKEPNAAYMHVGLAMLYMLKNDKAKAEAQLIKAQGKIGTWSKPKNTAAYLYILAGQLEQAEKVLNESEGVSKQQDEIVLLRTRLLTAGHDLKAAESEISKLKNKELNENSVEFCMLQGKLNLLRGRIRVAEAFYTKALEIDRNNYEIYVELADVYRIDNDTVNAMKFYEKAIAINGSNKSAQIGLSILRNEFQETKSGELNYYSSTDVIKQIELLVRRNELNQALSVVNKAIQLNNWNQDLYFWKGKLLFGLDKMKDAEIAWKTGLQLSPYHFESVVALTHLYINANKMKEAEDVLRTHDAFFRKSAKWYTFKFEAMKAIQANGDHLSLLKDALNADSTDIEIYKAFYKLDLSASNYKDASKSFERIRILGGGRKDSMEFVHAMYRQFEMEIDRKSNAKALEALKIIERYSPNYLVQPIIDAKRFYHEANYKAAMSRLNHFKRYLFILSLEDQMVYHRMHGYVLLELGFYNEAIETFKLVNSRSTKTAYLGIAMAQYELGQSEQVWLSNFTKDKDIFDLNQTARERYKKMNRNKGYDSGRGY